MIDFSFLINASIGEMANIKDFYHIKNVPFVLLFHPLNVVNGFLEHLIYNNFFPMNLRRN